jgi:hypothetical protein
MAKKALIRKSNNEVCDVVDSEFPVHSDFEWVDCDDDVKPGSHQYDGSSFSLIYTPTYSDNRANAYPSIKEQLDMQYWDQVNGTTTWKDAIKTVKDANPKP